MSARLFSLAFVLTCSTVLAAPPDRLLPPPQWWHEARIADRVKLSGEQRQKLDALSAQGEEIARLERDMMVASRDVRTALEAREASSKDIIAAGERLAALRSAMFSREIRMLAAQREILTQSQWMALQEHLEADRPPRREGRGPGPNGRGGRPPRRGF